MLAIIPARSGSKGIPNKNIIDLNGKPLIGYTIEAAHNARTIDRIVVSTDDYRMIPKEYLDFIDEVIIRPKHLADDYSPAIDVVKHAINYTESYVMGRVEDVIYLQPTSPLRTYKHINDAIYAYYDSKENSLYSGYYMGIKTKEKAYDKHLVKPHFQRNGAIFITNRKLIDQAKLWDDKAFEFEMPKSDSVDIDDCDDLFIAESILKNRE